MRRLLTSGIFIVFCFLTVIILAQVPQLLNYQGRLTDDKGIPIITPTTVRFSLYQGGDAATPGSGTLCYQEDASVTPDDNGVFSHLIGSGTVIFGALDATVFQTADPVFLEITIDPAGANETLLPRKQIVTVGYSFKSELADDADTVDGQDASAFAPVVHNHDPDYVNEGQSDSVNSSMIVDGAIVDADINASANIAASKINPTGLNADLLDGKDSLDFVHTAGDDMTGTLNILTSSTPALYGTTSDTSGKGVSGYASATSGITDGVYGRSDSSTNFASGVYGVSTATTGETNGVYGKTSSNIGYGVMGSGPRRGVYGIATNASGDSFGVFGYSVSTEGRGVFGHAIHTTGTNYGVYGASDSTHGKGVYGYALATTGTNYGLHGRSDSTDGRGVAGYATATSGTTYGVLGSNQSTNGMGVYGYASATSGANYGVYGNSNSPSGYGVYGTCASGGYAGYFEGNAHVTGDLTVGGVLDADLLDGKDSEDFVHTVGDDMTGTLNVDTSAQYALHGVTSQTSGRGIYGEASAAGGYGVYGQAPHIGVYGFASVISGINYGVYGRSVSTSGYGLYGIATATSGSNFGVYGKSHSSSGYGVYGTAPNYGVYGLATGTAPDVVTHGVYGQSNSAYGGRGVYGLAATTAGLNYGVYGRSNSSLGYGVYGYAPNCGVHGVATATSGITYGVYGQSDSSLGYAVYGWASNSGAYAGYFDGKVNVTGDFTVGGIKTCVQPIDNGKKVLLYAMESPEIWFEDFGTAQLVNGQAVVQLESVFTQTANTEAGYMVFLTPIGEWKGLYISRKDKDSFEVREQGGGTSSISFDYRIVAKRRGYEEVRFEEFTEPEQSPEEPNLPTETKAAKLKQPQRGK